MSSFPVNRNVSESWSAVTPAQLAGLLVRRLPSIVLITLLVTAVVVAILVAWPNRYGSDGMMYVRLGRGALGVDPTANSKSTVSMQESRTTEVVSVGEMIGSREIAQRAVDKIGVDVINQPRTWIDRAAAWVGSLSAKQPAAMGTLSADEVTLQFQREDAIRKVQDTLKVDVPKNGYTVAISARASDPLLARQIVQTVMNEYGRYHVEAHHADGSLEFFESQVEASRTKASQANRVLQETKNAYGWISVQASEQALRDRSINMEIALSEAESRLADADSRCAELAKMLEEAEQWIPIEKTSGIANAANDEMRSQLYEIQIEEQEALAKISPKHPRYRMLKEKLSSSSKIVRDELDAKPRIESREAINPVYQELLNEYQTSLASVAGLKSRREALRSAHAKLQADIKRLNQDAVHLAQLEWDRQVAERNYLLHTERLDEARISHELDGENFSDVSIIQPASLNLRKVSPPRALLAIVGCMLGGCLGCLQALLRDWPSSPAPIQNMPSPPSAEAIAPHPGYSGQRITTPDKELATAVTGAMAGRMPR